MQEELTTVTASDGTRLNVRVFTGQTPNVAPGTPVRDVLLLHGWPFSSAIWRPLAERLLLAAPFRLIAPDLRGFGASDAPEQGFTIAQFADDVSHVSHTLGLTQAILIGHSMSGKIAQYIAAQTPAWLTDLVLLTPTPLSLPPTPPEAIAGVRALYGERDKVREFLAQLAGHPLDAPLMESILQEALQVSRAGWNGWNEAMRNEAFPDLATHIAVDTLVVAGQRDTARPPDTLKAHVVGGIKGAKFVSLPGVGHLPHVEDPSMLAMLIVNFLDGLPVEAA